MEWTLMIIQGYVSLYWNEVFSFWFDLFKMVTKEKNDSLALDVDADADADADAGAQEKPNGR